MIRGTSDYFFEVELLISCWQVKRFPSQHKSVSRTRLLRKTIFIHIHWGCFSEPILHAGERKIERKNEISEKYKTL